MRCTAVWLEEPVEKWNGLSYCSSIEGMHKMLTWMCDKRNGCAKVNPTLSTLVYLSSTLDLWLYFPPKWISLNSLLSSHVQLQLHIPVPWFCPSFSGFWWVSRLLSCLTQLLDWFSVCLKDLFELRTCLGYFCPGM